MAPLWVDKRERIRRALERILSKSGYEGRIVVVVNADRSVDGQLDIEVPRGVHERDIIRDVLQNMRVPKGTWFSYGAKYSPSIMDPETRKAYLREMGKIDVSTYYARSTNQQRKNRILEAMDMVDTMRSRYKHKALAVTFRLYWHPRDLKPERKGK